MAGLDHQLAVGEHEWLRHGHDTPAAEHQQDQQCLMAEYSPADLGLATLCLHDCFPYTLKAVRLHVVRISEGGGGREGGGGGRGSGTGQSLRFFACIRHACIDVGRYQDSSRMKELFILMAYLMSTQPIQRD